MEICRTIQDKLKELMSLDISIGVGSWARTQQELRASHELAEKAIEYRYLLGGSLLIDMEEQPEEKNLSIKAYVEKLERLTQTSENYQKNAIVIRSRALQGFVDNIKTRQESLEELAALGIDLEAACYRVAVFDNSRKSVSDVPASLFLFFAGPLSLSWETVPESLNTRSWKSAGRSRIS